MTITAPDGTEFFVNYKRMNARKALTEWVQATVPRPSDEDKLAAWPQFLAAAKDEPSSQGAA